MRKRKGFLPGNEIFSTSRRMWRRKGVGWPALLLQSMANDGSSQQVARVPKGYGIEIFPQYSTQSPPFLGKNGAANANVFVSHSRPFAFEKHEKYFQIGNQSYNTSTEFSSSKFAKIPLNSPNDYSPAKLINPPLSVHSLARLNPLSAHSPAQLNPPLSAIHLSG
ncbi:hypothetical protein F0562_030625 [Nyssa sinensis]|uniref:Uncharacterized protein n=1 Tax=Nyssa sinensis TaxID=561372 RepID=A0A5J5B181_9ASTE|nr:hypothetical protein F0562_030625 [Nyssa sinensis]